MKMIRVHYLLISLLAWQGVQATPHMVSWFVADETFIKEHSVSEEIAQKLDQHSDLLGRLVDKIHATERQKHGVWTFDWLPGYYIKYNVSRVVKREILAQCIEEEGLHLLHTPEKLLYHIKGRPTEFSSLNYVVVCKKVRDDKSAYHERMDLEQVRQFITAIEKTGHLSTFEPNFLRLSHRKISFIDTDGTFNTTKPNTGFTRLLDRNLSHYYTPEALAYIIDKIAERLVSETNQKRKKKCITDIGHFLARQTTSVRQKVSKALEARIDYYQRQQSEGNS